jgi:membrane fusion protein, multidrug efflux system
VPFALDCHVSIQHGNCLVKHCMRFRAAKGFLLALVGQTLAWGCRPQPPPPPPPPGVTVAPAEQRNVAEWEEFSGRIQAIDSVEIRPRVSGYIQRVAFQEGKEVHEGQLLFQIDPRPYRAELLHAEAELVQARSLASLADKEHARARALLQGQAITHQEVDRQQSNAAVGSARVQAAQSLVVGARLNLEWTRVRSPIDGRVGRAEVTAGNLVQAGATGAPRLTTVVSQDPVHVYFDADERSFLRYAALAHRRTATDPPGHAAAEDPRPAIHLGLANEEGFPHRGYLDFVDNQLDPRTGTVRARALFENKQRRFTPGLFARLRLEGATERPAVLISDRAVGTDQDKKFVLVLKADSTLEYRPVQLGRLVDGYRVIVTGLTVGERIVVGGLQRVRPGMKVVATEGPMLATASADRR